MNHEHTSKLHRLRTLHLFAGAGGGILADILLGHQPVCAVEIEPYCQQVLHARQQDGSLPWFPIFADVKEFDGRPWRGRVDVVCGGFPCQDISLSGKGAGLSGERSGLWREFSRVVREVRPRKVFVENSAALSVRGLGTVLGDLAAMGFDAKWCVLGANDAGGIHRRERIWIVADRAQKRTEPSVQVLQKRGLPRKHGRVSWQEWIRRLDKPVVLGSRDDVAGFLDRHFAIGNGQVPAVAALAWRILSEGII
jgi:DNA (cytosine-5)-methyltransferase 1